MRKFKIAGLLALVISVVVVATISVKVTLAEKGLSDLSLANVEVLAKNEVGSGMNICCTSENEYHCAMFCACGTGWESVNGAGKPTGFMGTCDCGRIFNYNCVGK